MRLRLSLQLCLAWGACALVHFLVAPTINADPSTDPTDEFYDAKTVQRLHLEIAPEDLDRLHAALPERIYVPGTFRWKDQTVRKVGIRYKGNSSSQPRSLHKRSYLVDFSEFEKGQRFLGLRHVALDNGIQFGSLFSERLITDTLREVGVKASRSNYAVVFLNDKPMGVYVNVERIDKSFLERHFETNGGPLFKVDEGGPGSDLRFLGNDPAIYRKAFELRSGKEDEAYADLIDWIRALNANEGSEEEFRKNLDVDAFVKTTAVLLFAGAFDQYTGWLPHNYYLYRNPANQRWSYIPWDLDVGFADGAFGKIPVLAGWHAAWPAPLPQRPLMERLIGHPKLLAQYREQASSIQEKHFRPEILIPKLRALHEQIRPYLAEDPFPARRATVPSDRGYEDILASMEAFIRERYALARAQLDAPGKRPQARPLEHTAGGDEPKPGPPSDDAPAELAAVTVTASSVTLRWTNRAEGTMAHVVQRCSGAESSDFVNAIGKGGQNITTATDRHVQTGSVYRYRVYAVRPTPGGPKGTGVSNEITVRIPER